RTRVAGASGLDLEGVPLRLPRIGRHAPTEGKGVIHLGRDYLTGVGHETGHVVIAKPRLLNDKPALLGELDPNCPLWRVLHQDYQAVVWLFRTENVCGGDAASCAVELNRRHDLRSPVASDSPTREQHGDDCRHRASGHAVETHGGSMRLICP